MNTKNYELMCVLNNLANMHVLPDQAHFILVK